MNWIRLQDGIKFHTPYVRLKYSDGQELDVRLISMHWPTDATLPDNESVMVDTVNAEMFTILPKHMPMNWIKITESTTRPPNTEVLVMDAEKRKFIGRISEGNEVVIEPWDGFTYPTLQDFTHYAIITEPKD